MDALPVMLKVVGRRCVVVGGGAVAVRRAAALAARGADVTVIAPRIDEAMRQLNVTLHERPYETADLDDAMLVVIATDSRDVNELIAAEARARGVLANRADDADRGDLSMPAHVSHGPITIAVDTGGISAAAAVSIRGQLSEALDPAWADLLTLIEPWRDRVKQSLPPGLNRQAVLRKLADCEALDLLKQVSAAAVESRCRTLLEQALAAPADP